jgi:hypothetical protein
MGIWPSLMAFVFQKSVIGISIFKEKGGRWMGHCQVLLHGKDASKWEASDNTQYPRPKNCVCAYNI